MSFFDLAWWWSTPWGITVWLAAATGLAGWLAAAGYGAYRLSCRVLGWHRDPPLREQLDASRDEVHVWRGRAKAVPEEARRARHLAAAWLGSEDWDRVAAGSELGLVLGDALSVKAVAGREVPCVPPCEVCGRPADPQTEALDTLADELRADGHLPGGDAR
jgi:hypothetical protein